MRRRIIGLIALATAGGLWVEDEYVSQDSPTPPHTIEPMPLPGTPPPKEKKPTDVRFGDTFENARLLRPGKLGHATTWTDEDDRSYSFRAMGTGIREHGIDYGPDVTTEEYGAWLVAGSPEDTDAFLAELRGE